MILLPANPRWRRHWLLLGLIVLVLLVLISSLHIVPHFKKYSNTPIIIYGSRRHSRVSPVTVIREIDQKEDADTIWYQLVYAGVSEHYFTNVNLCKTIAILPAHYNFEIQKTLHRIDTLAKELGHDELTVSLQFPEGLMLFACIISDILTAFAKPKLQTVILGDVTYGACCIDDIAS